MTIPVNIEVQARTDQAVRNLKNLTDGAGDIKKKFNDDAAGALGVFGVSLTKLDQPLTLVAESLKASIDAAAKWGDSMGDLAQLTGASVEDTSKLAATFELVGVSTGTLEQAMKSMTKNGLALNMSTLKKLGEEYKALQDPVEKNTFLTKNFGRAGLEMAEIMGRSSAELDKLSNAALRSGKVIGGEAADAAEEFNTNMAIMQQKVEGAQIAIGNLLLPVLNDAATSFDQLTQIWQYAGIELAKNVGLIDQTTASAAEMKAFGIEPAEEAVVTLTDAVTDQTAAVDAWSQSMMDSVPALSDLTGLTFGQLDATAKLSAGTHELTNELIFQAASEGLSSEAKLQLAASMGLVKQESIVAAEKIQALKQKYDTNRDGVIDLKEATSGYLKELQNIKAEVDGIPDRQVKIIEFAISGNINGNDVAQLRTSDANANRQILRAGGGPVSAGQPYIVGERGPEWFVPSSSGTVLPNGSSPMANMNVSISINGAGNPEAVAAAIDAHLNRLGRSTDNRLRTR